MTSVIAALTFGETGRFMIKTQLKHPSPHLLAKLEVLVVN